MLNTYRRSIVSILFFCLVPATAFAEDAVPPAIDGANTAWLLTSTALVLFMTLPGLALFYGGLVRRKNVLSISMQCVAITCLMSLLWMVGGYGLAFGNGGAYQAYLGSGYTLLEGIDVGTLKGNVPETVFLMFQMTFIIITPCLILGSFAERMKFSAILWFSLLWALLVYIPICHWVWGGGWLGSLGLLDFAGGTVVHINAGVASLIAAIVIGNRRGFPEQAMPPHNMTLTVAGASMLWVGWYGFNAGSALAANGSAGMAMLVTHISAAAGSLAWMVCEWVRYGKPSILGIVTGMVAGLGTITPASGYVGPIGALIIGLIAGLVCFFATQICKRSLRIDDSLDVFPVHGVGGMLGTLMAGVFVAKGWGGIGYADGMDMIQQVKVQAIGVAATVAWSGSLSYLILKALDWVIGIRVTADQETEGLDIVEHEERGYNL